jgi:hypothetical protein
MTASFRNFLATAFVLAQVSVAAGQNSGLAGNVTDANGKPVAAAHVSGSEGECCPSKRDAAETDLKGDFRLNSPGQVIYVWKEGFAPQTVILKQGVSEMHIVLQASKHLNVPACGKSEHGYKEIGTQVSFYVPKHGVKVLGGKWDVDYVVYLIKPRRSASRMQLWFGPYAISMTPDDELFVSSSEFAQRDVDLAGFGLAGEDSSGYLTNGNRWRHLAFSG